MKSIKIILDKCLGCGACAAIAPDVFEINDDGKAFVKDNWQEASKDQIKQGIEACPMEAIKTS